MVGFSSYDDLISETTVSGKVLDFHFNKIHTATMEAVGTWTSLWQDAGLPGAGANSAGTPGAVFTGANGSLNWANQSPDTKHILTFGCTATATGTLMLYDRLCGVGGISVATTGDKTITSAALTRYTDGIGVQAWLEFSTAGSASTPIVTLNSYTDNDGNTGQTGTATTLTATPVVQSMFPLTLASGDTGVRAISTINVGTATTAGVVNVLLIKPLAYIATSTVWNEKDMVLQLSSLPRVYDGASLGLAWLPSSSTAATTVTGCIRLGYG